MDWVQLLIPLIAVAVWILSHLANQNSEARRSTRTPPPAPRQRVPREAPVQARPNTDQDQYRAEMDRKREKLSKEVKPIVRQRPKIPPFAQRQPQQSARPAVSRVPARGTKQPPPVEAAVILADLVVEPITAMSAPTTSIDQPLPTVKELFAALRNKDSIYTAIILKEILDAPVSKRRRS